MNGRVQSRQSGVGLPPLTRTVKWLIIICGICFFVELVLAQHWVSLFIVVVQDNLMLVPGDVLRGKVWMLLTHGFLHDPSQISHILLNMFGLYIFGPVFESAWGRGRFLRLYFGSLLGSGLTTVVVSALWPGFVDPYIPHLGASGAVMGLLAAFSVTYPQRYLYLFFVIPIKAKFILPLAVVIDIVVVFFEPISITGHWGGMLIGGLIASGFWNPRKIAATYEQHKLKRRKRQLHLVDTEDDDEWRGPYLN